MSIHCFAIEEKYREAEKRVYHPQHRKQQLASPNWRHGLGGLVKGNKTLGAIMELLKTETSEAALIEAIGSLLSLHNSQILYKYGVSRTFKET